MEAITGPQVDIFEVGLGTPRRKTHLAREEVDRLVFPFVVLQRKSLTRVNVQEFAYVLARVRPDEFVTPRLFDASSSVLQVLIPVGGAEGERSERPEKVTLTDSATRVKGLDPWHEKCDSLVW